MISTDSLRWRLAVRASDACLPTALAGRTSPNAGMRTTFLECRRRRRKVHAQQGGQRAAMTRCKSPCKATAVSAQTIEPELLPVRACREARRPRSHALVTVQSRMKPSGDPTKSGVAFSWCLLLLSLSGLASKEPNCTRASRPDVAPTSAEGCAKASICTKSAEFLKISMKSRTPIWLGCPIS